MEHADRKLIQMALLIGIPAWSRIAISAARKHMCVWGGGGGGEMEGRYRMADFESKSGHNSKVHVFVSIEKHSRQKSKYIFKLK